MGEFDLGGGRFEFVDDDFSTLFDYGGARCLLLPRKDELADDSVLDHNGRSSHVMHLRVLGKRHPIRPADTILCYPELVEQSAVVTDAFVNRAHEHSPGRSGLNAPSCQLLNADHDEFGRLERRETYDDVECP